MRTALAIALSITLMLAAAAGAAGADEGRYGRVRVIDGRQPVRAEIQRTDEHTRVITIKGTQEGRKGRLADDVCADIAGKYYCLHVGKQAVETATNRELGRIVGVAWKSSGDVIGFYFPGGIPGDPDEVKIKNTPATQEGFFYLIDDGTVHAPYLVECFRVTPLAAQ